jgi:hypothetical protein
VEVKTMRINKLSIPLEQQAEQEYAQAVAAHNKAVQDYNIMMGNLEDPSEEDEGEEDE